MRGGGGGGNHLHFLHLLNQSILDVCGHEYVLRRKTDLQRQRRMTISDAQNTPYHTIPSYGGRRTVHSGQQRTCPAFEKRPQRIRFAASARSIFGSTTTGFFPVHRDHTPSRNR